MQLSFLACWSFNGLTPALVRLFETSLRRLSPERKTFWLATCELAAGNLTNGRASLVQLQSQTRNAVLQAEITARLARAADYANAVRARSSETELILQRLQNREIGLYICAA